MPAAEPPLPCEAGPFGFTISKIALCELELVVVSANEKKNAAKCDGGKSKSLKKR